MPYLCPFALCDKRAFMRYLPLLNEVQRGFKREWTYVIYPFLQKRKSVDTERINWRVEQHELS
jgi:hypothetical protein